MPGALRLPGIAVPSFCYGSDTGQWCGTLHSWTRPCSGACDAGLESAGEPRVLPALLQVILMGNLWCFVLKGFVSKIFMLFCRCGKLVFW